MATRNKVVLWPLFSDGYLCCLCGATDVVYTTGAHEYTVAYPYGFGRGEGYKYSSGYLSGYGDGDMAGGGHIL